MAFSSCLCHPLMSLKIDCLEQPIGIWRNVAVDQRLTSALTSVNTEIFGRKVAGIGTKLQREWSFVGGSRITVRQQVSTFTRQQKGFGVHASWLASSQIASTMFTWGTVAVLPFYTLMVFAPKAELTKKFMESSIPYVVLGLLYTYLLYLSWTPDTLRLIFASKHFLPELPGIARMFSSEMTLASAWLHLLAVDLFAARQVFHDGLQNEIETRHSISLCLFFCPVGILTHVITKALAKNT